MFIIKSCGGHGWVKESPVFDYTCDDCMLPYNHKEYDQENDKERTKTNTELAQDESS